MAKFINTGTTANDGTGDPLKTAFDKINAVFQLQGAKFGINNDAVLVGKGTGDASVELVSKADGTTQIVGVDNAAAEKWAIGHYPTSTTHPTDAVILSMVNGGIVLDVKAGSQVRIKEGTDYAVVATDKTIREFRATVVQDIADHAKPTAAECVTSFKQLPNFDWKQDDDYYIKDTSGGKIVLIKYRGTPTATEAAPGNFFYEVLTKAV